MIIFKIIVFCLFRVKVIERGHVTQMRDAFYEQESFKAQHELEMRQREEQQRIFRRIDQSRHDTFSHDPHSQNLYRSNQNLGQAVANRKSSLELIENYVKEQGTTLKIIEDKFVN